MEHPAVAVLIENDRHHPLFAASTDVLNNGETGIFEAGESAVFTRRRSRTRSRPAAST